VSTITRDDLLLSRRMLFKAGAGTAGALGLAVASAAPARADTQPAWRWCNRCQVMFYQGNHTSGWCCEGGGHDYAGSGNYTPAYGRSDGQPGWCWCHKCQCMWYTGRRSSGYCASGDGHSHDGSGDYRLRYGRPYSDEQDGWRCCNKCYVLCYSGQGYGYCARGGHHDFYRSRNYCMAYTGDECY
jgi:hypothetical protein